jgi:pimeloyl-ACP methyl ester carboxylesterase
MDASLPRRPILGIAPAFSTSALTVGAVREGSMAALAGLSAGDTVKAIDGKPVRTPHELRVALMSLGQTATIDGATVAVQRRPMIAGTAYDHVTSRGVRLRTLIERRGPTAALFLQGISLTSIEDAAPVDALLRGLGDLTTVRFDKRGVGDSEGAHPDFVEEVADAQAVLSAVDAERVILIGHSVGGMIAPLLRDERIAAIVAIGSSAERWFACLDASARRQAMLSGVGPEEAVRRQRQEIEEDSDERSRAFHHQLDATDLRAAWSRVRAPVLVMHGEYDWVVSQEESRAILPSARFVSLPGVDHAMTRHASIDDSLLAFGRGALDPSLATIIREFVRV